MGGGGGGAGAKKALGFRLHWASFLRGSYIWSFFSVLVSMCVCIYIYFFFSPICVYGGGGCGGWVGERVK